MRQPRPWATSWGKSYKRERQQKTGREGRSSRPVLFCPFRPFRRVGHGVGQKFLASPQSDFLQQKKPKTKVFRGFSSCYPDLNRRPHPYQLIGRVRFFAFGRFCVFFRSTDRTIWHSCVRCLRPLVSPCGSACGSAKMVPLKISTTISKSQYFTHRRFLSVFNCSRRGAGTLGSNF